ncbi:putative quinol monooxygenase [Glaciibacter psychrotolerans]|uniref:Quinol monooxygenase YgiN n=1 Tax=Glaciibacter psychrotolerans TaxID=670054 RepID=A0A7Z0EH71_9MICO|nr:putative quinol monooxygenase [Leifsonia psychrotolerans]NYJ21175.1 quinol monooxygenase YgiN [Leifsonia psychrotolerans]
MSTTLIATFQAKPGHRDEVRALIDAFAEVVREEPGNVLFEPSTRVDDDHSFVVYEQYLDQAAFDAHVASPAGGPFNEALLPHIEGDGSVLEFLTLTSAPLHEGE